MSKHIEKLMRLIKSKDTFHEEENKELNHLLITISSNEVPDDLKSELMECIDMMLLTGNVSEENKAPIEVLYSNLELEVQKC